MILYRIKQASSDQTIPQFLKQTKVGFRTPFQDGLNSGHQVVI